MTQVGWSRLWSWCRHHTNSRSTWSLLLFVCGFSFGFLLAGIFAVSPLHRGAPRSVVAVLQTPETSGTRSSLNGVMQVSTTTTWPVAVAVENHFDSWPQSGLDQAQVVYEILAEGGITRFLALYDFSTTVAAIGPVRSARPYQLDYLSEYPAIFAHSGGSPEALSRLESGPVIDLNEFSHQYDFYRSRTRWAPHNLYTSSDLLQSARLRMVGTTTPTFTSWLFADELQPGYTTSSSHFQVRFSRQTNTYNVDWYYDQASGRYWREQAGQPHRMSNGVQLMADTIIVMVVPTTIIDDIGRLRLDTLGRGMAMVFRDGVAYQGNWRKESVDGRTIFYSIDDHEIALKPGQIWVQVIRAESDLIIN